MSAAARRAWWRWAGAALLLVVALAGAALLLIDTAIGHRFVADRIAALRPDNGLRFWVGRIEGSLFGHATLIDVRIGDPRGVFFSAPRVSVGWRPFAWLGNTLDIEEAHAPVARFARLPALRPTARQGPILPGFDIRLGTLRIDRLRLGAALSGQPRDAVLAARAEVRDRRALVDLRAAVAGSDTLRLLLDAAPDADRFDLDASVSGTARGVLARQLRLGAPLALRVAGDGSWTRWRGELAARVGGEQVASLRLGNDAGRYRLNGSLALNRFIKGNGQKYVAPRVAVAGDARLVRRVLDGELRLASAALKTHFDGAIDLARSRFVDLRVTANLSRPDALNDRWTGRPVALKAIIAGPIARATIDYRLAAEHLQFGGREGLDDIRVAGLAHVVPGAVLVPVRGVARGASGVDPVAASILAGLTVTGDLRVADGQVRGTDLAVRAAKLTGLIDARFELGSPDFDAHLDARIPALELDGLGLITAEGALDFRPGALGHGLRFTGAAKADVRRLDNELFQHLGNGLPHLETTLAQNEDRILHFPRLVLTAPDIRLEAAGYHTPEDRYHFDARGQQARYGPVARLVIDGRIDRPTIDLSLPAPNAAMGLSDVTAHFDPDAAGYQVAAQGGSLLGHFEGSGPLLLPPGGRGSLRIARLAVAEMVARGEVDFLPDGLRGALDVTGKARGSLGLRPVDGVQRVEAHLDARDAVLGWATVRRARLDAVALLDPKGSSIEVQLGGAGLRDRVFSLGRFTARASLRDGHGTASGEISGVRGRAFTLGGSAEIAPERVALALRGTVEGRPLAFDGPAVFTRSGEAWRLAATRLRFQGGEGTLAGEFGTHRLAVDATLARLPLTVLDLAIPDLGLIGSASGKLSFAAGSGAAPTGAVDLRLNGLARPGLVVRAQAIDVALAGVLRPEAAAFRAVMGSGGKVIGRAQGRLAPLVGDTVVARLANAPVFAQLRYDGPADTLWRLSGIELFDLSGPIAIGADIGGRVNDPRIQGLVRARGARIESTRTGTVLTNASGEGRFAGSRLTIADFSADAGRGGRVTGGGSFDFAAVNGFAMDLRLQARRAVMLNRDDIGATVSGPIAIVADGRGGEISGELTLDASRYRLGQAAGTAAVPKLNIREINLPAGEEGEADSGVQPWRLNIRARGRDALAVNGLGLNSLWSTELRLGGNAEAPTLDGRADLIRGTYEFSGREFEMRRGVIRFLGETPPDPTLDITAAADTTGLNATIRVTGQASRPEIGFASTPALPQDELLSRLLFGASITKLSAPEALQLAAAVAALQNGGTGLNPINALRRAIGLDRLRVLPADAQQGRQTAFGAGKYITRRLYAEIITDGAGYSATQVEFRVTRWLAILSTISTLGRQSANVRVSKDY